MLVFCRQHSCHAWELVFKVLWLLSQVEPCCHVPNRERTISPKEKNSQSAIEVHQIEISMFPQIFSVIPSLLLLLCFHLSATWGGRKKTWLIFHSACLKRPRWSDQRFLSFSGVLLSQHEGEGCSLFGRILLWNGLHTSIRTYNWIWEPLNFRKREMEGFWILMPSRTNTLPSPWTLPVKSVSLSSVPLLL